MTAKNPIFYTMRQFNVQMFSLQEILNMKRVNATNREVVIVHCQFDTVVHKFTAQLQAVHY
jgi:hypothetical protein